MVRVFLGCLALMVAGAALAAVPPKSLDLGGGVKLEVVPVAAGTFMMGSPAGEAGRGADEEQHEARIKGGFLIGKTPVTRGQFARFVAETRFVTEAESGASGGLGYNGQALVQDRQYHWRNPGFRQTDADPVVLVTYKDALKFAAWLGQRAGLRVTLPNEAQWEYACRAGTATRFYSGDRDADAAEIAWFKDNAGDGTRPAGKKRPNAWGLCDMSGDVCEWCLDYYGPYRPGGAVVGTMEKPRNVLRGGSWLKGAAGVRSAARYRATPGSRNADFGFRIVCDWATAGMPAPGGASKTGAAATPVAATRPGAPGIYSPPQRAQSSPGALPAAPRVNQIYNRPSSFGSSLFLTPLLIAVMIIGVIAVTFLRAVGRSSAAPPRPLSPTPRPYAPAQPGVQIADDGFWFDPAGYIPGDLIRYAYQGPHGLMTRDFVIEPGGAEQFIYTGMRPDNLVLTPIIQTARQPDAGAGAEADESGV